MSELRSIALTSGGISLSALERPGRGTPLVMLHGVGGNAFAFKPLIDRLPGRHVIAIDMPMHGLSGAVPSLELADLARTIFDAVDAYLGRPAIWCGHSWGGKVAAIIAAQNPRAIESLILLDPSPAGEIAIPPELAVDMTFGVELGPWDSIEAASDAVRHLPQYAHWNDDREQAFRRGLVRGVKGEWRAVASREALTAICAALGKDHSMLLRTIDCPTLLVVADQSLGWQEVTNIALLPRAACVVVASNHWLMFDNPDDLARAIGKWIEPEPEALAVPRP